ncbi:MAG: hypothetical protein E6Q97_04020 [Desulfurellales bacterium]|nr:MAG: hypothetical protein E6Q97_04020 [Desulfurellales bacterium]
MKAEVRSSVESADHDPHQEHTRRQLSVNFLVYRNLISQHLLDNPKKKITQAAMQEMHRDFAGYWHDMFDPDIAEGMSADEEFVKAAAGKYSGDLAEQVNEVSDRAFMEGYNAAVNKGWERAVAWERISQVYGLDPSQMRSWVTYYPADGYHPQEIPSKSQEQADRMLYERANRIATHEAWSLKQMGKQAEWTQRVMKGELSPDTKKIWITARDELVCPVCAPMDNIVVGVNEQFKTQNGKFFAPPVHINCRCEIYLQFDAVAKSMGNDRWNRDRRGRFSTREERSSRPLVRVKTGGAERGGRIDPRAPKLQYAPLRGTDTTGRSQQKPKAEVDAKAEAQSKAKPRASVGAQSKARFFDIDTDGIFTPAQIGGKRREGDLIHVDPRTVKEDRYEVGEIASLINNEQRRDGDFQAYVIDTNDPSPHGLYVVTDTLTISSGEQIDPDLLRLWGGVSEDTTHSREGEYDDSRTYVTAPKDIHLSRAVPYSSWHKDALETDD